MSEEINLTAYISTNVAIDASPTTQITETKQEMPIQKHTTNDSEEEKFAYDYYFNEYDPSVVCKISLFCSNSRYMSSKESGRVVCDGNESIDIGSVFYSIPRSKNKIRLKSVLLNKYLLSVNDDAIECTNNAFGYHIEFAVIKYDNAINTYSFKWNEKYLSFTSKGLCFIKLNDELTKLVKFKIKSIKYSPFEECNILLLGSDLKYISPVPLSNGGTIVSDTTNVDKYQIWKSVPISKNKIALMSTCFGDSIYLSSKEEKNDEITHTICINSVNELSKFQEFEVFEQQNGKFVFKSCHNKYLSSKTSDVVEFVFENNVKMPLHPIECNIDEPNQLTKYEEWDVQIPSELRWYFDVWTQHFGDINDTNQSFRLSAEFWICREMTRNELKNWMTDKSKFEPDFEIRVEPYQTQEIIENEYWNFGKNKEFVVEYNDEMNCYIIRRCFKLTADFIECLELKYFPFDVQHFEFPIIFRVDSEILDTDEYGKEITVSLLWSNEMSKYTFHSDQALLGWEAKGIQLRTSSHNRGKFFITFFDIVLKRQWKFYFWRIAFILGIVSFMTLCVFTFDSGTGDARLGFVSTMFLTAVAYMFITKDFLPPINYLTLLDVYVYFVMIFQFGIAIEIAYMNKYGDDTETEDEWILFVNLLIWFVFHLCAVVISFIVIKIEKRKLNLSKEEVDKGGLFQVRKRRKFEIKTRKEKSIASEGYRSYWKHMRN